MEGFLLNEQTWLQHLKEKRLAYGLSQNRLAVATGITRQYLSDIETGKVKPSEDLQQSLWEALERFNPDAPLEMLFDYVRIRFPTTDVQQVVENILQLKLSYFLHEDYGFYSYSEHYESTKEFLKERTDGLKAFKNVFKGFVDKVKDKTAQFQEKHDLEPKKNEFELTHNREVKKERSRDQGMSL